MFTFPAPGVTHLDVAGEDPLLDPRSVAFEEPAALWVAEAGGPAVRRYVLPRGGQNRKRKELDYVLYTIGLEQKNVLIRS